MFEARKPTIGSLTTYKNMKHKTQIIEKTQMTHATLMPDESYLELQRKLRHCIEIKHPLTHNVRAQLEAKFMAAWRFNYPDRRRRATKRGERMAMLAFDHRAFYHDTNDLPIFVTQPCTPQFVDTPCRLTFENGSFAEIFEAPEWAFHSPGKAALFIVRFSADFNVDLDCFKNAITRPKPRKPFPSIIPDQTITIMSDPAEEIEEEYPFCAPD